MQKVLLHVLVPWHKIRKTGLVHRQIEINLRLFEINLRGLGHRKGYHFVQKITCIYLVTGLWRTHTEIKTIDHDPWRFQNLSITFRAIIIYG